MVSSPISSIRGALERVGSNWADVALGGITFRVNVPDSTADYLSDRTGHEVRLFTSLQVREDSLSLYGFLTEEYRSAFDSLLGVNSIGPRMALGILSRFTPESLAVAVGAGDTDAFATVPGVGKKTASRIVLELKGKLEAVTTVASAQGDDREVVEALAALGYSSAEVRDAVASLPRQDGLTVEDRIRLALQHMAGR